MSSGMKIGLGIFLVLFIVIGGSIGYIFSAKFTANNYEASIKSQFNSMENTWGQMEQQLQMAGFATKDYGDKFIATVKAQAERYANDKNTMMKWVQEAGSQMSPTMHTKFVDIVEKSFAKKEMKQDSKIAVVEQYEKFLGGGFKGMIATGVWNYPTAKTQKMMDTIVSTKGAKTAMETGVEAEVKNPFGN
jgi:hypothetical protein